MPTTMQSFEAESQDEGEKDGEKTIGETSLFVRTLLQTSYLYSALRWMTSRSSICAILAVA